MGSVSQNETVTAIWKEGTWTHIEYSVTGTSNKKRGYVPTSTVNIYESVPTITFANLTRYVITGGTTYTGPASSGYVTAGSVSTGETVQYSGQKPNDYAFIEYAISGTSQKKRAYFYAANLATSLGTGRVVGQYPPGMNINGSAYQLSINMYYPSYVGECTWFCWGRAYEKTGKSLFFNGPNNGGQWYANINTSASNVTKRAASLGPVTNSICSCSGSTSAGHVIFVELVEGNDVYYTEANVGGTDGVVKKTTKSNFPVGRTAYGYIVL